MRRPAPGLAVLFGALVALGACASGAPSAAPGGSSLAATRAPAVTSAPPVASGTGAAAAAPTSAAPPAPVALDVAIISAGGYYIPGYLATDRRERASGSDRRVVQRRLGAANRGLLPGVRVAAYAAATRRAGAALFERSRCVDARANGGRG